MNKLYRFLPPALLILLLLSACRTDFEVYAPEEEVFIVYGVLYPLDTVQYVRIGRAYQVEGDAYEYASANDLSRDGLNVRLEGNGHTYNAVQVVDMPRDSGLFWEEQVVYKFVTDGSPGNPMLGGESEYTLRIGLGNDDNYVTSKTWVPGVPDIKDPESPFRSAGNLWEVNDLNLAGRLKVEWFRLDNAASCDARVIGYELRVGLRYQENGVDKQVEYGPTTPVRCNSGCAGSNTRVCYQFAQEEILNGWRQTLTQPEAEIYTYDATPVTDFDSTLLPKPAYIEVTAIDEHLTKYIEVNNPAVLDLAGVRPEYTNIESGSVITLGVFGSRNTAIKYYILDDCSEYKLGLNATPQPNFGCVR